LHLSVFVWNKALVFVWWALIFVWWALVFV
jgi:hypothetical protein